MRDGFAGEYGFLEQQVVTTPWKEKRSLPNKKVKNKDDQISHTKGDENSLTKG